MDPAPSGSLAQIPLCFSSCAKNSPRSCRCTEKVDLFFVMGLPSILHSDNGQEFVNKLIDEVFATCRGIVLMQHHKRISCCLMNGWMILLLQLYKTCCDKSTQLPEGLNHHHLHRSLQWSHRQGNLYKSSTFLAIIGSRFSQLAVRLQLSMNMTVCMGIFLQAHRG